MTAPAAAPSSIESRRPSLAFPLVVFVAALALLLGSGDLGEMRAALGSFRAGYLPAILGLSLVNYVLRLVRWEMYLRQIGVRIGTVASATIFASGLAMSVTPGKAGELVKAYGLHRLAGTPVRRVIPVVLMERVSDAMGVLLLAAIGATNLVPLLVVGAVLVALHALLLWPRPIRSLLAAAAARPRLAGPSAKVADAFDSLQALARPGTLLAATVLSIVAWGAEGVGLYLTIEGLGGGVTLPASVMAYAVATLAGAVSFLPGGLIVTEGSMTAILMALHLPQARAALATTICRVATLWFAVALGCAAFLWAWPQCLARKGREVTT